MRDVKEDWHRQRLYIPRDILASAGIEDMGDYLGQSMPRFARAGLPRAVGRVLGLADRYYQSGDRGLPFLPVRAAFAIRTARKVYAAIGTELQRRNCDALSGRVVVARRDKFRLVMRALVEELVVRLVRGCDLALSFLTRRTWPEHSHVALAGEGLLDAAAGVSF
jgi:phytoene synthase